MPFKPALGGPSLLVEQVEQHLGRADQHASHDSNPSLGVLFCRCRILVRVSDGRRTMKRSCCIQHNIAGENDVDAVMRYMQGTPKKTAIVRFGALSMRMGVAGIWSLPSRPVPSGNERGNAGDQPMANVVEFYIPNTFQKRVKWTPPERRGKVIEFYQPAKRSA